MGFEVVEPGALLGAQLVAGGLDLEQLEAGGFLALDEEVWQTPAVAAQVAAETIANRRDLAAVEALEGALDELTRLDDRQARIVELRFLAGLTVAEVATVLGVSEPTVKRDWRMARAWLLGRLTEAE